MSIVHASDLVGPAVFGCAQAGCRICQDRLVRQHEGLVHFVLRQQGWGDLAYADLLQVGRLSLWQAVLHFEAERGVAFSTYAVTAIQRRLWRVARQDQRTVRSWPAPEPVDVRSVAEETVWWERVEVALREAVQRLPARPRQALLAVYGLAEQPPQTFAAVGRAWGVSGEAVRYWHTTALLLLRLPAFAGRLRQVADQDSREAYARSQALSRSGQRQRHGRRP